MKKIYLLIVGICLSAFAFSQVPLQWGARLDSTDWADGWDRDTVLVVGMSDDDITGVSTLEELWGMLNDNVKFANFGWTNLTVDDYTSGESVTTELPAQSAEDFTGEFALLAGTNAFYILWNITDDEFVAPAGDNVEIVLAPYPDAYDPERTIHPNSVDVPWNWDADSGMYKPGGQYLSVETYHAMASYGLWGETGAVKLGGIDPASSAEIYAGTMYFKDVSTMGDTLDGIPRFGTTDIALQALLEPKTGGIFYLLVIPWNLMEDWSMSQAGDAMSIALKYTDFDNDNPTYIDNNDAEVIATYQNWTSQHNDAYWAVAYYGNVAEFAEPVTSARDLVMEQINAYYASGLLHLTAGKVSAVDIYSITGAKVMSVDNPSGNINVSGLENGVYITRVKDLKGATGILKFVKY